MRAERRVWIHAVGVVSGLGPDWATTARALARGASSIAPIARFDTTGMPCSVGSVVDDAWLARGVHGDRRCALAVRAVTEAWTRAALVVAPARIGVFVGAESGMACFAAAFELAHAAGAPGPARAWSDPTHAAPGAVAWAVARQVGATGACRTVSLACASGAAAILEAARALRAGACDVAICVGVGADVDPLKVAAFGRLGALSTSARAAPFDARRDGFVLGEGAAALVLAVERGAAEVHMAGGARTYDGGSLVAPDAAGGGAQRAVQQALASADVDAVGFVAAHGTSTPAGDAAEIQALRGAGLGGARISSLKGALGHWIAGAGTLGAVAAWHAITAGELLPTVGVTQVAADCDAPHVLHVAEAARVDAALACSFGFGGANACLVFRRAA